MARYEHLSIYKKAMDLAVYLEKIVRNFSRYHKYTFGTELRAKSREIVGVTIAANFQGGKARASARAAREARRLQVVLRICKEVRAFNGFSSYAYSANLVRRLLPATTDSSVDLATAQCIGDVRGPTTASGCAPRLVRGGAMTQAQLSSTLQQRA